MKYRDKLYSSYISSHLSLNDKEYSIDDIERKFPVWKKNFGKFIPSDKSARIIDIGCGNGGFVYFLRECGLENAHGIDISKEQIDLGRKMGIENIEHDDLCKFLPRKQGFYDVIFAIDILEHFLKDEIFTIVEFIYESLKNDGLLVIQTNNGESPFFGRIRYGDFTHEIAFTKGSLRQLLSGIGFREANFYSTQPVSKGILSTVRLIFWKGIEILIRIFMIVETGSMSGIFTQNIIAVARK